ncbi:hypothetical protein D9611_007785 [Ephemerocybe angulata]|uniref:Uncharacterized protein n=1 Tax=Ephemerocybe angulata TaxID=980116 RepID=A0A8H5FKC6_9AGAR|nr:hypothetical protein D9611_007785 [Tulosesus angulatus]
MSHSTTKLKPLVSSLTLSSKESEKLLSYTRATQTLPGTVVPVIRHTLRIPLIVSYAILLLFNAAYLVVSGYASLWQSSAYIGAAAGGNSVFFAIVLLITSSKPPHPLASPPSSSLGARVCSVLLTAAWAVSLGFVIQSTVNEPSPLAYSEVATSVLSFSASLAVSVLQLVQCSRYRKALRGPRVSRIFLAIKKQR